MEILPQRLMTSLDAIYEAVQGTREDLQEVKEHLKTQNGFISELKLDVRSHEEWIKGHKEGIDSIKSKLLYPISVAVIIAVIFLLFPTLR